MNIALDIINVTRTSKFGNSRKLMSKLPLKYPLICGDLRVLSETTNYEFMFSVRTSRFIRKLISKIADGTGHLSSVIISQKLARLSFIIVLVLSMILNRISI